jgi:hypothetical protein
MRMTRGRWTLLCEIVGVLLIVGSCVAFPETLSPSGVRTTNPALVPGVVLGFIVMVLGAAPHMRGGGRNIR